MSDLPFRLYCPTYRRPHDVRTVAIFGADLTLCVHECEAAAYRESYPNNEQLVMPDAVKGNMARVRNYIRDRARGEWFVMMDDDINWFGYHEQCRRVPMTRDHLIELFLNGFEMARELGTVLWGINLVDAPRTYRQYSPISFLSPVLGPMSCHLGRDPDLRYDERLGLNEDYDYALQVLQKYRKILRFNKYFYQCEHLDQPGGCSTYRNMDKEKAQGEIMVKKWGPEVVAYEFERSPNPRLHVPLRGI